MSGEASTAAEVPPAPHSDHGVDATVAKNIVKKIDRVIMPLLFITYMFNFMDKIILSSASVFGLREDNHLHGQQYSWVSSIFYFGYLAWELPTNILISRLPTGKYLTANTAFWGIVVGVTAACTNFGGLMVVRFLLGVAEATITPGFMFLTSTWYTRDEMPTRVGIWFSGNSVGGLVSSLMAFGVGHIKDDVHPWRWMYIILGILTFLWTIPMAIFLPDSISKARFLSPEERQIAADRTVIAGTGSTEHSRWRWDQFMECLIDPKTWFIFCIGLIGQIPNSGTQNFSNIVIKSFGFSSLHSTLINIPYSLVTAAVIAGTGYIAGRYRTLNCILIVIVVVPCVIGAAVIYSRNHVPHGVQLFAYFLLSTGPASMPLNMALVQSNFKGVTKKMTITALLFMAYCAGNIAGPQFFRASEAPRYDTAFKTIMICYALVIVLATGLRFYLQWMNHRRTKSEGIVGSAGTSGVVAGGKLATDDGRNVAEAVANVQLRPEDYDDVTDWKTIGFSIELPPIFRTDGNYVAQGSVKGCKSLGCPGVEVLGDDEEQHYSKIAGYFNQLQQKSFNKAHHGHRATHIKTQGSAVGKMTIRDNLKPHLAQGMFAKPATHEIAVRYSSLMQKMTPDGVPAPRSFGVKVFDVPGEKLFDGNKSNTQDFTFNNYPILELRNIPGTYRLADSFVPNFDDLSKFAEEAAAREDADIAIISSKLPPQNPIAMNQWSQGAYRYGDYVAKFKCTPATDARKALVDYRIKEEDPINAISTMINDFHSKNKGMYTFSVQLLQNIEEQPVEDIGIERHEAKYPFVPVATLEFEPQITWTNESRSFWDDRVMCNPWHGLVEHRPLGGAQRTRRVVYAESRKMRLRLNDIRTTSNLQV